MYPCSGCLRGSDGCRRRCRKRPSDTDERPCHSPTVERYACKHHGRTHHNPLSAAVKFANTTLSGWRMAGAFARNGRFSTICHAYVHMTRATRLYLKLKVGWYMLSHTAVYSHGCKADRLFKFHHKSNTLIWLTPEERKQNPRGEAQSVRRHSAAKRLAATRAACTPGVGIGGHWAATARGA